jgi:hypothetical protein
MSVQHVLEAEMAEKHSKIVLTVKQKFRLNENFENVEVQNS